MVSHLLSVFLFGCVCQNYWENKFILTIVYFKVVNHASNQQPVGLIHESIEKALAALNYALDTSLTSLVNIVAILKINGLHCFVAMVIA